MVGLLLTLALFLQADLCIMTRLLDYVDPSDPCFVAAILAIIFNPLFWNVVSARVLPPLGRAVQTGNPTTLSALCLWSVGTIIFAFSLRLASRQGMLTREAPHLGHPTMSWHRQVALGCFWEGLGQQG